MIDDETSSQNSRSNSDVIIGPTAGRKAGQGLNKRRGNAANKNGNCKC